MHIYFSYSDRVSNELLQLAFIVWKLYIPFAGINQSLAEIRCVVGAVVTKINKTTKFCKIYRNLGKS